VVDVHAGVGVLLVVAEQVQPVDGRPEAEATAGGAAVAEHLLARPVALQRREPLVGGPGRTHVRR
jgi:hypothetical protein